MMSLQSLPMVDSEYRDPLGDTCVVIGLGTQGIVVEYTDGRVELIAKDQWHADDWQATEGVDEETRH